VRFPLLISFCCELSSVHPSPSWREASSFFSIISSSVLFFVWKLDCSHYCPGLPQGSEFPVFSHPDLKNDSFLLDFALWQLSPLFFPFLRDIIQIIPDNGTSMEGDCPSSTFLTWCYSVLLLRFCSFFFSLQTEPFPFNATFSPLA